MKTTKIGQIRSNSGFSFYAKVTDIIKHDNRDALVAEKISGSDPGKKFVIVQRADPDYKGYKFDADGLVGLKIKKGSTIGLSEASYLDKESEIPVIEVRRASKVGKDFRTEQALAVAAYGASMGRLNGYILTPKNGIHGEASENKAGVVAEMIDKILPHLGESQGLMVIINGKGDDGSSITIHRAMSRYTKENSDTPSVLLSAEGFRKKVTDFVTQGSMINFEGTQQVGVADVYASANPIKIAMVPSEPMMLTGVKYLDNGRRAVNTGIGAVGVAIDPANDERGYPIIQVGAMEMTGLLGFRRKGENGEKFAGPKVVQQTDDFIFNRLTRQIDLLNGINPDEQASLAGRDKNQASQAGGVNQEVGRADTSAQDKPKQEGSPAPAPEASNEASQNDGFDFNEEDPFNFADEDDVAGLGY